MSATDVKAFACHGKGQPLAPFSYTPRPLGPNDVQIRISACGICGSDIHVMDSSWFPAPYPIVPGHEIVGTVTQTGPAVTAHKPGDRVGVGPMVYTCEGDKKCPSCAGGNESICMKRVTAYAGTYKDGKSSYGGYAESVRVDARWVFGIPREIETECAAPLLCAGMAAYAPLKRAGVGKGMRVGVVGMGGVGHLAVQYASKMGASVVVVSHSEGKKEDAISFGAEIFVCSKDHEGMKGLMMSLDVVMVTGLPDHVKPGLIDSYLWLLKPCGTMIITAMPESHVTISLGSLVGQQRTIVGASMGTIQETREALEFAAKHGIRPWVETMAMTSCGDAVAKVRKGDVRFRMVLVNEEARSHGGKL
ncbi:chaperonin 10-like protein [Cladochytrium replicatum]|nr:chaperonin 10-like protein [Cladochytrium replicatum]